MSKIEQRLRTGRGRLGPSVAGVNMSKSSETSAEMCRRKADECRHGAAQARSPDEKANWLQVAEEWQAVAEKIDVTNAALSPLVHRRLPA